MGAYIKYKNLFTLTGGVVMPDETSVRVSYFMDYKELLKSPKWQKKRLDILQRDDFKCTICGDGETQLHIHHLRYCKNPIEQPNEDLVTLCKDCHELTTGLGSSFKNAIVKNNIKYMFFNNDVLIKNTKSMIIINLKDLKEVLNG